MIQDNVDIDAYLTNVEFLDDTPKSIYSGISTIEIIEHVSLKQCDFHPSSTLP